MPSVWINIRRTASGVRYRVRARPGGHEAASLYYGTFKRRRDAETCRRRVEGEFAAGRVPARHLIDAAAMSAPTLAEAAAAWRASRVDVAEQTRHMHRSAFGRSSRCSRSCAPGGSTRSPSTTWVTFAALHAQGYERETLRKTRTALAQTLDYHEVTPNPARDERVKLPKERRPHIPPPLAEHVEAVARLLARVYVLPLLILDWAGPRVSELVTAEVGDLDEGRRAIRVRPTTRRTSATGTSTCPTTCGRRCWRRCRRGRTAPGGTAIPRPHGRQPAHGDHPGVQGRRGAALLAAWPPTPPWVTALQAHRLPG